jgi:hypothetical protein
MHCRGVTFRFGSQLFLSKRHVLALPSLDLIDSKLFIAVPILSNSLLSRKTSDSKRVFT